MQTSSLTVAGLLLDIAGAVLVAWAVFMRGGRRMRLEATPHWNLHVPLHASLERQTADAQAGTFLLVLGFCVQIVAALGWSPSSCWALAIATAGALGVIGATLAFLFRRLRPGAVRRALYLGLGQTDVKDWARTIDAYADELGERRRMEDGETPADFGRRLLGGRRWANLTVSVDPLPSSLTEVWHEDQSRS